MALRDQLRRHGKDSRWIVGSLLSLLVILTLIYYFVQSSQELTDDVVTNRVLLFVLWYVNLVLIIAVVFVLLRNLFKLLVERHNRILGSRLKTKLVATYIGLSLLPVLLLFLYGSGMIRGWIEGWFDEDAIKKVTRQGYAVAEALDRRIEETQQRDALRVLNELQDFDLDDPDRRPLLARHLRQLLDELRLDYLGIYNDTHFVQGVVNSQSGLRDLPEPGRRVLSEALELGRTVKKYERSESRPGTLILSLEAGSEAADERRPIVVAGTLLDPVLATQSEQLIQAYQGYRQLEVRKGDIQATYILNFLTVTLLILLTTSWVGAYLARRITVPVQALAEGTKRLASGDLDFQVDVVADDELQVLVNSFNSMTADLRHNKELLEESNNELTATNQRLAEERAVIATVLQNVAAGVISVDEEGRVLTCNGAAKKILRQEDDEMVGKPILEAWSDPEKAKLAALFAEEPDASRRLARGIRLILGGEWKTFEAKVTTMRDHDGRLTGRVMVLEDLTELIKAQQAAAWNDAARRIAHEIKNPLTPIKLAAERMLVRHRQGADDFDTTITESVGIIVREVHAMKAMVDEFSRFARMPRPQPSEVEMGQLLEETLHLYRNLKPGIELVQEVERSGEIGQLDREQIKRALINLLDNAFEALEPPGNVTISVAKEDGQLVIQVSDTGPGIPAESREKLFLPYFSTKGRGTGLGLSIVHRIVAEHHGEINVQDNHPTGTVFTIKLPQD